MMYPTVETSETIARLNDQFRREILLRGASAVPGMVIFTRAVAMHPVLSAYVSGKIAGQHCFEPENDPYGEHDFGKVDIFGHDVLWKIDYYADDSVTEGSETPEDPTRCFRVLTIMRPEDY